MTDYVDNLVNQVDSLEYHLEQYENLVKKLDADNLPRERVFLLNDGYVLDGYVVQDDDGIYFDNDRNYTRLIRDSFYIELTDMISFLSGNVNKGL